MIEGLSDPGSERAVLSGVCQFGEEAYLDVADYVTERTFTVESNKLLWAAVDHLFRSQHYKMLDYSSLMSAAKELGFQDLFDKAEERSHLRAILNMPVQAQNVRKLGAKIRKLEITRLLMSQLQLVMGDLGGVRGHETINEILAKVETPIFDFTQLLADTDSQGIVSMSHGAREYMTYLMDNPREMMGISTGFKQYDMAIGGGVRPNSMDVIAARPKTGKTYLVDSMGLHVAEIEKVPALNLDTEMTQEEHLHRIFAHLSGIEIRDIETGRVGENTLSRKQIMDAADRLEAMPYDYQSIISIPFEEVLASMRRWVMRRVGLDENGKAKPCVVFYDYLKMTSAEFTAGNLQEYQALGFIATALKNFMGRYGVGCVCFSQLNREGTDREDDTVVSGSDRIVHYCTSLTIYKRIPQEERMEFPQNFQVYTHKLVPILSRHGAGLDEGDFIFVEGDYGRGKVVEGPTRNQAGRIVRRTVSEQPPEQIQF